MLDINLKEITQELEGDDLIFSYAIKQSPATNRMNLTLQQQETGFSLTIQLKEIDDALSVTKFSLTEKSDLEQQSLSLYDAAVVEIAVQALDLLFMVADHADQPEIAPSQKMRQCFYLPSPVFLMLISHFKLLRKIMIRLLIKRKF